MRDHIILRRIRLLMTNLNVLWLVFNGWLLFFTTKKIIRAQDAMAFMLRLEKLPRRPGARLIWTMALALTLVLVLLLQRRARGTISCVGCFTLEILLGIGLMSLTGYSYNAVMLILAAGVLVADCAGGIKLLMTALCVAIYVVSGTNLGPLSKLRIPLTNYLAYTDGATEAVIASIQAVIAGGTSLIFVIYLVMGIRLTVEENRRVRQLNEELDIANENLRTANVRLEEYALSVKEMSETRERNRLAREIHDTLGHTLTGIISGLDACLTLIDIAPEETKKLLNKTSVVARNGMNDVRRTVNALRPDVLENRPLEGAIRHLIAERQEISKVDILCQMDLQGLHFADDEEETIYRIVQESMTNAISHGRATRIEIQIEHVDHEVRIHIHDNGTGCALFKPGFGLIHMRERISMLNGTIAYDGSDGFTVEAVIPIRRRQEEAYGQ